MELTLRKACRVKLWTVENSKMPWRLVVSVLTHHLNAYGICNRLLPLLRQSFYIPHTISKFTLPQHILPYLLESVPLEFDDYLVIIII